MTLTNIRTHTHARSYRILLGEGLQTIVHVAKYKRTSVRPRVVLFEEATNLLDYCHKHEIDDALTGGFFLRNVQLPLGETWIDGKKLETVAFIEPWDKRRGSLAVDGRGRLEIAPRYLLPNAPDNDLMQAGPLLVQAGKSMIVDGVDPDGFSEGAHQFDDDITIGRFPRTAIGTDSEHIWLLASDGYTHPSRKVQNAGLSLAELADLMIGFGCSEALNLDGGSSSTLVCDGKLINTARGGPHDNYRVFPGGRAIFSAIVLEKS